MNTEGIELWSRAIMRRSRLQKKCKNCFNIVFLEKQLFPAAISAGIFTFIRAWFYGFPSAIEELSVGVVGFSIFFLFYSYLVMTFLLLMLPELFRKLHLLLLIWKAGLDVEKLRPVRKWSFDE